MGSKDTSTWVFGAERWTNLIYYSLGGHKDVMVGCFFEKDSLDVSLRLVTRGVFVKVSRLSVCVCFQLYTVSRDGTLCVWESDTELDGLVLKKNRDKAGDEEEEDRPEGEVIRGKTEAPKETKNKNVRYKQTSKSVRNNGRYVCLS